MKKEVKVERHKREEKQKYFPLDFARLLLFRAPVIPGSIPEVRYQRARQEKGHHSTQ